MEPSTTADPPTEPNASDDGVKRPTGRAAVDAVAEGPDAAPAVQASALAYFMGEEPPPGRDELIHVTVDFGTQRNPNQQLCVFRTLAAEELDKCEELAQEKNPKTGAVERINPFTRWSYVFAYACQQPNLGRALEGRRRRLMAIAEGQDDPVPALASTREEAAAQLERIGHDASGLVREVFRFQPGVLQTVSFEIEKRSRMGDPDDRSVVEVEAGKISS